MKAEHVAYAAPAVVAVLMITGFLLDVSFPLALLMGLAAVLLLTLLYATVKSGSRRARANRTSDERR